MEINLQHNAPLKSQVRPTLIGLDRGQIATALREFGLDEKPAKMHSSQIYRWLYHQGVHDFSKMTNLAKDLRIALSAHFDLSRPKIVEKLISTDGTRKYLIGFGPGIEVEAVFIPGVGRSGALCVSSQVGCTLNCTFCHTGSQALVRNLSAAEIVAQVLIARDDLNEWPTPSEGRQITNVVFMGMGEPLLNLPNVLSAISILSDGEGISISRRRITVSTSGIVPQMHELGNIGASMLAISMHAVNDELRNQLVPINKKYPIAQLLEACRTYPGASNARRITFEYVMLKGINDSNAEAKALVRLLAGIPAKINLIPFNPWPGSPYECSSWERIEAFAEIVNKAGYSSPVRTPRGRDIFAACGQLKSLSVKKRASERRLKG